MAEHNHIAAKISSKIPDLNGKVPNTYLIIDILQNAKRRSMEGNFDDAVARLYRCLEMVIQYVLLLEYDLVSSDVDLRKLDGKIPEFLFQKLSGKSNVKQQQKVEVGLVDGFEILCFLNREQPTAVAYLAQKESLKTCLYYRNNSILAHGITPVDKKEYEKMEQVIGNFVKILVPDIDYKLKELEGSFKMDLSL